MSTDRAGGSTPEPGVEGPLRPALAGGGAVGVAGLAVGAVALVAVAVWAWVRVPELYPVFVPAPGAPALSPEVAATRDATRAQSIVTTRASVLAALAGIGALVTIAINFRNSQLNARTLATTQSTFRVTERGHLTDRYTKAIEQLGHDSIAIRLGGIYALQQLAVDTGRDSDQATVVEVLSAFVRLNLHAPRREMSGVGAYVTPSSALTAAPDAASRNSAGEEGSVLSGELREPETTRLREPRADVLAAISVLAQLPVRSGVPMRADFTGLDFTGLDLSHTRLAGSHLEKVQLIGADLSRVDLRDADLTGATLHSADLSGADLTGATLVDADLTGATLSGAVFRRADLTEATLTGATLVDADFMLGAVFRRADLTEATLTGASLVDADFTHATLNRVDLTDADLRRADLTAASLAGATLVGADLRAANLSHATLYRADLTDARLTHALLTDVTLAEATLESRQLGSTYGTPRREVDSGDPAATELP